jgi:hypothetical protein
MGQTFMSIDLQSEERREREAKNSWHEGFYLDAVVPGVMTDAGVPELSPGASLPDPGTF